MHRNFSMLRNIRKHALNWRTRQHNIVWVRVLHISGGMHEGSISGFCEKYSTNKVGVQEAVWGAIQTLREHRSKSNMLLVQVIILIGNQTVLQFLVKDEMCIILRIRYSSISYIGKKEYLWRQCSRISS